MEAEEPEHGASAPSPAIEDFKTVPEAIMRSSQIPSLEPEAQEGQDPSYKWADSHRLLMNQPKDVRDMSDHTPDSVGFFLKEVSSDVESNQEILVAEACDTPDLQEAVSQSLQDRVSRTIAAPELSACGVQEEWLDKSSQLDSRVEAELQPELMSLTLSISSAKEEEETPPDTSNARGSWPSCRKHPGETDQSWGDGSELLSEGKQLQLEDTQEKQGQEGLLQPLDAQGLEEQEGQEVEIREEGTLREDVCSDGLLGEQEEEGEEVNSNEDEQKQDKDQNHIMLGAQRESEGLSEELGVLDYSECGQEDWDRKAQGQGDSEEEEQDRELREVEERRANVQFAEEQGLVVQSENVSGKQAEHAEAGKVMPVEEQQEVLDSGDEERGSGARGGQAAVEGRRPEDDKCCPLVDPVAPEGLSPGSLFPGISCSDSPGVQRHPAPKELIPQALTPALEPIEWSHQPISPSASFATEEPLEDRTHNSQQEAVRLRKGGVSIQGTEVVSATVSVTPRTPDSAPFSSTEVFPLAASLSPVNAQVLLPGKDTLAARLSTDTSPHCGAFETPPLPVKTTKDPRATSGKANHHSPLCSYTGATQHLRSNSFPGFHRTEQTPDSVGMSSSFSHSELPQRPPKPAIYGSLNPRRDRRSRDGIIFSDSSTAFFPVRQDSREFASNPEGPSDPHGNQLWSSPQSSALATGSPVPASSPSTVSMDMRIHETLPPPPPEKRHSYSSVVERDCHLPAVTPALKRHSHPPPLALSSGLHGSPKGPFPLVPDSVVARQLRPLPSTPEDPHHAQTSIPPRLRYNKPLPPTPNAPELCHSSNSPSNVPKKYRPLPPVPPSEPPPLPPKSRERSRSIQGAVRHPGDQAKPRPTGQDRTACTLSVGRTSWPPATGRSTDSLAAPSRGNSEVSPGLAFSNMTNLLSPSSPTTPWIPELQRPISKDEFGFTEESESPVRGSFRRSGPQEIYDTRRSSLGPRKQSEKPIHHQLEKTSSCPDRHPARTEGGSELAVGQASNKHKSWNRQGLRRPSLLPESASDLRNSGMGRPPGSSDSVVFREKKPKEGIGFSRRCSKLINSSQLLYQEYSDVVLNKEIQSQQRLDSLAEGPGISSPRQRRKAVVPSDSYLQRLSMASSGSLWQEIPVVRNSTVLLSMTHEDQKLQEAKFELIVSEASYLRSLNIAVDHFQHSAQLRASLSTQDHQWLFSRLQDVRDVSTTFLSDLEENFENNIFSFQVCDVVLNHAPDFRRVYLPYVTNQTYQERTFQSLMNSNSTFREVLEKLESDPICQRLSLKSFLILPFQRITRLKLLLQNILKRTQPGSSEEAEATKAHHALEKLIRDCNSNVQRMRRTEELIYLSQKIEFECKIFPLISQSRWLVKSGELTALEFSASPGLRRKLTTRPVHLHLFNDCLLLSRPREGNRFLVFDHAPFSSIRGEKCEMKLHGAHKNLFRLFLLQNTQGTQVEFLFSTETQSEKLRWISALAMPREELDLLECYDSPQVQCLRAYKPRENDELALEKADVVMVTQQSSDGWLEGVRLSDGEQGWFPIQQVEFISNSEVRAQNLKEAHRIKTAKLQLVEQQV
ncbi:rho guanine nucleotide exchange factor 5 [Arvicola amphibius]|uniref:rho guanine nucleotide exchange factor 5 n=1 Tax=Arvicola amphibius TaxID=1047088 RepID=UPI0018E2B805|nr:rho guanine nucleotide exchange factor 5 [Arvicola amphibius]XP_038175751.1 rho guanine nucleotide exchange factor 5 [Arvicola amphibius]